MIHPMSMTRLTRLDVDIGVDLARVSIHRSDDSKKLNAAWKKTVSVCSVFDNQSFRAVITRKLSFPTSSLNDPSSTILDVNLPSFFDIFSYLL